MTSAHRYPPPQTSSQNDFRLPSLKDLNFAYRPPVSGPQAALPPSQSTELGVVQQEHPQSTSRHPAAWGRTAVNGSTLAPSSVATVHQQHASSLSASHDAPSKVDYKHENGGYAHPGIPLSAQATPIPGSVNTRNESSSHSPNQPKRQRTTSTNMAASRDVRASHPNGYPPPQYASYPPASQPQQQSPYHPAPQGLPAPPPPHAPQSAPPPHEQVHHPPPPVPVTAHNGYTSYQHAYVQPRQTLLHPQHSPHPPPQQNHPNPYPSPGPPPPSAPPPQGPWAPHQQPQHHQAPPPSHHQQQAPPPQQQPPPPAPPSAQPSHQQHPSHAQPPYHHQPPQHHQHQHQQPHQPHHPPPTTIPPSSMHNIPPHQAAPPPPPPPSAPAHAPPPHQPIQQQPQYTQHYPQQPQQPPQSFSRPTTIAPTALETRPTYTPAPPEPTRAPSVQNDAMAEIMTHCTVLHDFANRYASIQQTMPHAQPAVAELEEMSNRALTVVRLLHEFRQINLSDDGGSVQIQASPQNTPEESRPPKRPWEDVSQDDGAAGSEGNGFQDQQFPANPPASSEGKQTSAEQDMELIRTKRLNSTAAANGSAGQPKSKYRKRSRASPPGKCHSCNIRETPEWRRGPDGARTLCNACGLHYAKLMRKQSKANGEAPPIDLETLRASARAADIADKASRSTKPQSSSKPSAQQVSSTPDSPMDTGAGPSSSTSKPNGVVQQPQPSTSSATHQGSFQIMISATPEHNQQPPPPQAQNQPQSQSAPPSSNAMQVDSRPPPAQQAPPQQMHQQHMQPPPPHHAHAPGMGSMPPPPPWPTTARGSYGPPPEQLQHAHQSFMRGSTQQATR